MLYREFEYNKKFSVLANDKFGNYDNIKYFGINKKSTDEVRNQIEVLFYNTKDDFNLYLRKILNSEILTYFNYFERAKNCLTWILEFRSHYNI